MNRPIACALLFLVAFLWGSGNVAQKTLLVHLGPLTVVGITSFLAALIIWPYVMWAERGYSKREKFRSRLTKHRKQILLICIVFTGAVLSMQLGYGATSVTKAGFLGNTNVAMIPITAWLIAKERPNAFVIPSVLLTCTGIWLLQDARFDKFNEGDLFSFIAAIFFAIWTPLVGRFVQTHGQPGFLTLCQFMVCGTACLAFAFSFETITLPALWLALPQLILLGIISKGASYLILAVAQQHAGSSVATIIVSSEAVFGAIFANILLFETMTNTAIQGAILVFLATIMIQCPELEFSRLLRRSKRRQSVQKQLVSILPPPSDVINIGVTSSKQAISRAKLIDHYMLLYATRNPGGEAQAHGYKNGSDG